MHIFDLAQNKMLNMNTKIEVSGILTKKELLVAISPEMGNMNLILETAHAFPGYHGNFPEEKVPGSLFLVTKKKNSKESIIRSSMALKKLLKIELDLVSAKITVQNQEVQALRIKGLANYSFLPQIIDALEDLGYRFERYRPIDTFQSIIEVKKEFLLKEIENGFFMDMIDTETHYFQMEKEIKWDVFEKAIVNIKFNISDNNFDAALASIFRSNGIQDLVRIYKKNLSFVELKNIKYKLCEYIHA